MVFGVSVILGVVIAAAVQTTSAGSLDPMTLAIGLGKAARQLDVSTTPKADENISFELFFRDTSYLLKPEEAEPPDENDDDDDGEESEEESDVEEDDDSTDGIRRSLVRLDDDDDGDDDLDEYDDYGDRRSIGSIGKQVIKQIGKVGLTMLKKGLKFLKSTFFKFGGKRLLKRAKEYLKKNMFSIEPLNCENTTCKSCAAFNLPMKIKSFKACAEMGFKRLGKGKANFSVALNVVNKDMFSRDFEVGDIANCYTCKSEPDATIPLASLIGKVCVQGFKFQVEAKDKKAGGRHMKFCLALVFKRWATGFRFCAEKKQKKKKESNGKKNGKHLRVIHLRKPTEKSQQNETQKSHGEIRVPDNKKFVWKITLKKIAAGEQENQIVGDKPLFKGESQKRKEDAAKTLDGEL